MGCKRSFYVLSIAVLAVVLLVIQAPAVLGAELLPGGSFEQGAAGWRAVNAETPPCAARSGDGALGVVPVAGTGSINRTLFGPMAGGTYTLTGWASVPAGSTLVVPELSFTLAGGAPLRALAEAPLTQGVGYTQFTLSVSSGNATIEELTVRFIIENGDGATVCLDDLTLQAPDFVPTETPTPTATPTLAPDDGPTEAPEDPAIPATATRRRPLRRPASRSRMAASRKD